MATLNNIEILAVVFVVVLACVVAGLLLYLLRRLRHRREKLLTDLQDRPELNQDRAFNRLAMARREAQILAGQGLDVRRAQELIAEAQGAFDTRQYDRAYRVAQSAHEALVNARQSGARLPTEARPASPTPSTVTPSAVAAVAATPPSSPPPSPAIPKNRAESQFQIRLLSDELNGLPQRRAKDHSAVDATALRDQASGAFDRGDYAEAFRLALRGRRTLGATVESLPPAVVPVVGERTPVAGAADAEVTAATVASAERCPDCGYPALAGDAFCRGCGRPRTALTCGTCGAPRARDEPFCGRCGTRFT